VQRDRDPMVVGFTTTFCVPMQSITTKVVSMYPAHGVRCT
jgi:hypothetical protein